MLPGDETGNKYKRALIDATEKKYLLLLSVLKQKGPEDLYLFNKHVLKAEEGDEKFVSLAPFHKTLCNFVTDRADRRKLILVPRGHLKSKLITIGYSLQQIVKNPKVRILIYSATWQMAVDLNMAIQKALQEPGRLTEIWGSITEGATEWSQDRFRLKDNTTRDPTVTAAGIDNNLVGGHYDIIIMDDVVNRDNVGTMDQMEKVMKRYKDSLDLLEPRGQLIVIGTRWHDSDLYGWILDPSNDVRSSYEVMKERAFEGNVTTGEGCTSLWPQKYTLTEFQKLLREQGWSHFSAQYLNDPVPEEDAVFKKSWFTYYEDDLKGRLLNKFMLIDPALSKDKSADYTAMIVIGIDPEGYIFILDIVRARLDPSEIIDAIVRLVSLWNIVDVGIEMVAFQKSIAYSLRQDSRFIRRPFHISELKPQERSKTERIKGLQPLYEQGKIIHKKLHPNTIYLEDELVRFPSGTHDDMIDALSYGLDLIYPARQPARKKAKRHWLY